VNRETGLCRQSSCCFHPTLGSLKLVDTSHPIRLRRLVRLSTGGFYFRVNAAQAKLAELAVKEPARVAPVAVAKPSPVKAPRSPAKEGAGYDDASAEIADIDSRLHALQNFLKSAKASRP